MDIQFNTKKVSINGYEYTILLHNKVVEQNSGTDTASCALLALCNVLLLSPGLSNVARNLVTFINARQQVSKNDLIQTLSYMGIQQNNTIDINQLLQTLPNLCYHTKTTSDSNSQQLETVTVNPVFNGSFEDGMNMSIFRLYNVGLVHGWIISPVLDPVAYDHVSKYSYENAQRVLIQSYDINRNNLQVANADAILQDANYLKSFLARSATQLTEYGLNHLKEIMVEKSFAVLYRNDGYFTLHKNNGELYILVVDNNYNDSNDIVWKSLKSVSGNQDSYYTGDFIPASAERTMTHVTTTSNHAQVHRTISNPFHDKSEDNVRGTQTNPEGNDAQQQLQDDELLARKLQEQEDEEYAAALRNTYVAGKPPVTKNHNQRKGQSRLDKTDEHNPDSMDKNKKKKKIKNKLFSKKNKSSSGKKGSSCTIM